MTIEAPVLIVGAGPVGLLTGLLLDQHGIDYRIVERRPTLHQAPQAHVISSRTLEICRSLGIDDGEIRRLGPNPADTGSVRWVDRLVGRDLGVFAMGPRRRPAPAAASAMPGPMPTPTPSTNLSQDRFEQVLFDHLDRPERVLFGHAWTGYESTADGYRSTIEIEPEGRGPGEGGPTEIRSQYLIGADGAGSRVRKALGIEMVGPDNIQTYLNIHFRADLRSQLAGREGLLYWVMDDEVAGTFIAHDIEANWIFMKTVGPDDPLDPIDEDHFGQVLRRAIGADQGVDVDIISMNPWRMTAQIADRYRHDGVFLIGDAAHRFPPTGGIGMNTGMADAHNLVWKIAMVNHGADPSLLDTYEPERKPVAEANSEQSLANAMKMFDVAVLLDVDGDSIISAADLDAVMADADRQAQVQAAIDAQAAHFNMVGLDLGFCYPSGPTVIDDGPPPALDDPVSTYVPSTVPGVRLPHVPLVRDGEPLSTLDLVRHDGYLVLAPVGDAADLDGDSVGATVVRVGPGGDLSPGDESYERLFGDGRIVVVRPDGHIAARLPADASPAAVAQALDALPGPVTTG